MEKPISQTQYFRALIGGLPSFEAQIERLQKEGGMSKGRAILFAKSCNGNAYNAYRAKQQRDDLARHGM